MSERTSFDLRPFILLLFIAAGVFRDELHLRWDACFKSSNSIEQTTEMTDIQYGADGEILDNLAPFYFQKINVNTANSELLQTLQGVGPSLAEAIITCREQSGPFHSVEDLRRIKGIGEKRAEYFGAKLRFE